MTKRGRMRRWLPRFFPLGLVLATVPFAGGMVTGCANGVAPTYNDNWTEHLYNNNNQIGEPLCGNGSIDPGETCDDGNLLAGDGCDSTCHVEACGAGTCSGGCCDAEGMCHPGTQARACGSGGGACDDCTVGARVCEDGACQVVTECEPGDQQDCGDCGVSYCDTTGHWGGCVGEGCQPGLIEQGGTCGSCGVLERSCDPATCAFGDWTCEGEGPCETGTVETGGTCGSGGHEERICSGSCQWEAWTCEGEGVCVSGTVETGAACGNCGHLERTCTGSAWGPWTCVGQGVCAANDVQTGSLCGNCGIQERTCDPGICQWSAWTCVNEGVCVAGEIELGSACANGSTEERTCEPSTCQWGAWTCPSGCPVAGHLGTGDNGDLCDQATQDEKWRCVYSATLNAWVSQVCRDYYQPGMVWQWINYAISPTDCAACCDTFGTGCT